MGVDYGPVLFVGRQFKREEEVQEFYEKFFELSEEDKNYIEDESFSEFCSDLPNSLSVVCLNRYSGYGFVFGIDIGGYIRMPEEFGNAVNSAISKWKELFGEEPFNIIHTVSVW